MLDTARLLFMFMFMLFNCSKDTLTILCLNVPSL